MFDLLFSLIVLIYFSSSATKIDSCFYTALIYNILHILLHLIILIPVVIKLIKHKTVAKLKREYIKSIVISRYRMPGVCWSLLALSLASLYSIIIELFSWTNYSYLFTVFCLIGSSLTHVSNFVKIKKDCSLFFSMETYKFFCLAVSSILFGISAHEVKLTAQILGMGWAYFVYRSKQSLPKQIIYYLILFMDVIILLTAIVVIGASHQSNDKIELQQPIKSKYNLLFSASFFGFLFSMEIYEFIQLYRAFGRRVRFSIRKQGDQIVEFYTKFLKFKENGINHQAKKLQNYHDCAICLEDFAHKNAEKGEKMILNCGHCYHSECLQQWAIFNSTCPMCRRNILSGLEQQIYF